MKSSPDDRWVTIISIACENKALAPYWKEIEHRLRAIVARVGWDPVKYRQKLEEIGALLTEVEVNTPDWRLAEGDTFSRARAASLAVVKNQGKARPKSAGVSPRAPRQ